MDRETIELSRAGLRAFTREEGSSYADISRALRGELGSLATAEGVEASRENVDLINDLVNTFPGSLEEPEDKTKEVERTHIECVDAEVLAKIKSSVVWYGKVGDWTKETLPCFVIGQKESKRSTQLLLRIAGQAVERSTDEAKIPRTGPFGISMRRKKAEQLMESLERNLQPPTSELQLRRDYLPQKGLYSVQADSRGSMIVGIREPMHAVGLLAEPGVDFTHGISDIEMRDFNVLHNINRLANLFGVVEAVDVALENAAA